jgi:DNA modification methylase
MSEIEPVILSNGQTTATLYCGDCLGILPTLGKVDAVVTDPPYGIRRDRGMRGRGYDGFGRGEKRKTRAYVGGWDSSRPSREAIARVLKASERHIIWGGPYFADLLPVNGKWLVWDKCQTMPSYSDAELAWTSLTGNSIKMFRYNGSGLLAKEKDREHPTQKPIALMKWCLGFLPDAGTVLDPFMGSGTTGVACAKLGRDFIGIELAPGYFEIAVKRIKAALAQPSLFA